MHGATIKIVSNIYCKLSTVFVELKEQGIYKRTCVCNVKYFVIISEIYLEPEWRCWYSD